jgi:hypothetical protein
MKRKIDASGKRFRFFLLLFFHGSGFHRYFIFSAFLVQAKGTGKDFSAVCFHFQTMETKEEAAKASLLLFVLASRWKRKWNFSICLTLFYLIALCLCIFNVRQRCMMEKKR